MTEIIEKNEFETYAKQKGRIFCSTFLNIRGKRI